MIRAKMNSILLSGLDDYETAHIQHEKMSFICYANPVMGICFVTNPDDYWRAILPEKW